VGDEIMNMKLVLVPVPVSDVDRAKDFYVQTVGFDVKTDAQVSDERRVVQLTPPGSDCSIVFGTGMPKIDMPAGSLRGLHLEVPDIDESRSQLLDRGVKVSETEDVGGIKFASFADPDGNTWALFG
jgi:predicted enzyme related to lactoylglutathione lyase